MRIIITLTLALACIPTGYGQSDSNMGPVLAEADETSGKEAKPPELHDVDVTGEWRQEKRGPRVSLRKSGNTIYGERERKERYAVTYELKRQANGSYRGFASEEFSCYGGHFCRTETPMQVTELDANRIEGRIFGVEPPKGLIRGMKYCDTCGESEADNATWQEFVWVRE